MKAPGQTTDTADILRFFLLHSLARASARKRLWLGAAAIGIFIGTIAAGYLLLRKPAKSNEAIGYDFIAFYTAGRFVRDGRTAELYDLHAVATFQHDLALKNGTDLGTAIGPYWNPPFYAWLFVPLAKLSFPAAMKTWVIFNLLCAAGAAVMLCQIIRRAAISTSLIDTRRLVTAWALVPVLMVLSTPFIHALSHAQNTCTSLLILTITVVLWRAKRAFFAGLVGGLLFYKPQLAAVLATVLVLDLGRRALAGFATIGVALLCASLALPGMIHGFIHQMPANLHFVQDQVPYLWERHVTFKAFWRLLLQGSVAGNPTDLVRILSWSCSGTVGAGLLWAIVRSRTGVFSRIRDGRVQVAGFDAKSCMGQSFAPTPSYAGERAGVRGRASLSQETCLDRDPSPSPYPSPPSTRERGPDIARERAPVTREVKSGAPPSDESIIRDRLIAATVAATPLLMPFYFDYDQLLLAIPAVLFAAEWIRRGGSTSQTLADRWLVRIWPAHFVWLMINPDVALATHINFTVVLLTGVCGLLIASAGRQEYVAVQGARESNTTVAAAA